MIDKLITKIKATDAPIVVGLDPMLGYIPNYIKEAAFKEYGETLEGAAEAVWQYNKGIVDAIYDLVPAVKPQVAMYEQFGLPGLVAFHQTVQYCKEKGLVVIGDIKRGDIGSTSAAYATGHIGGFARRRSPLAGYPCHRPVSGSDPESCGRQPRTGLCLLSGQAADQDHGQQLFQGGAYHTC